MSGGNAHGENLAYQVLAYKIVEALRPRSYEPVEDDGIDVPFQLLGSSWKIDVALRASDQSLLLIECKRHKDAVAQSYLAAFAYLVAELRRQGRSVEAWFFVKGGVQSGALNAANYAEIKVVEAAEQQPDDALVASFVLGVGRFHNAALSDAMAMTDDVTTELSR